MLGPVMTSMRVRASSRQSLAMKSGPAGLHQPGLHHRVAALARCRCRAGARSAAGTSPAWRRARPARPARPAPASARASAPSGARWACSWSSSCSNSHFSRASARSCAAQRLVLEGLQLGRDEALGVLQRLAALVVGRHLVDLAGRDLDVEAVHPVELHPQVGDAGAGALARLQVEQEGVAVLADGAQLVEVGVEAGGDHAAVAQQHRGFVGDGRLQQGVQRRAAAAARRRPRPAARAAPCIGQGGAQHRQQGQRGAQAAQLARAHLAQRQPGGDALDIADLAQRGAQRLGAVGQQRGDGVVPRAGRRAVARRVGQPVAQQRGCPCRSGSCRAATAAWAPSRRAGSGSVPGCGGWPAAGRSALLARATSSVATWASAWPWVCSAKLSSAAAAAWATGRSWALKPCSEATFSSAHSLRSPSAVSNCQAGPRRAGGAVLGDGRGQAVGQVALRQQQLGRVEPGQPAGQLGLAAFGHAQLAAGQAQPGQAPGVAQLGGGAQQGVDAVVEQLAVGDGAGRHHPHHLALDRALGGGHVAHLLGNRHRLAQA